MLKKAKNRSRVISFVMALLMVASLLPSGLLGGAFVAKAAENKMILNASDLATGDITAETVAGDFTLGASSSKKFTVQADAKGSEDGTLSFANRLKTNGGSSDTERIITFTTDGAAEITVYMLSGSSSDAERKLYIVDAAGTEVEGATNFAPTSGADGIAPSTYTLAEAGTYTFKASAAINIYYIEVEVTPASTEMVLNASDLAEGDITAETVVGDFTLGASSSKKFTVQADAKASEDGTLSFVNRLKTNGGSSDTERIITFTTDGAADITVYMLSGSSSDAERKLYIVDAAGTEVEGATNFAPTSGADGIAPSTYKVTEAGTYTFKASAAINIYYIAVTPAPTEMVLNASDLAEGDITAETVVGDFTLGASSSKKFTVQADAKASEDGTLSFANRLKTNGGSSDTERIITFTTDGAADITVYMLSGSSSDAERKLYIVDAAGTEVEGATNFAPTSGADGIAPSTYTLPEAGTYTFKASAAINIYYIKVVSASGGAAPVVRPEWNTVADPVIADVTQNKGAIEVTYNMVVGDEGADSVVITMKDAAGKVLETKTSKKLGESAMVEFSPSASGTYTFSIEATRADEANKTGADASFDFTLPLGIPFIASATSNGGGKINVVWDAVDEATGYNVYCNGTLAGTTTTATEYEVTGLTVGTKYVFKVTAVRGAEESAASAAAEATATQDAQRVWASSVYGPSTGASNGFEGNLNDDGKVTVYSEGGKGKLQNTYDGVSFYYTAIPTNLNFTLRAKVTVDSWTISNGQDGFGIMVTDRLGKNGDSSNQGNNAYMALASKIEYVSESTGAKYSMKLGLGVLEKVGLTKDNIAEMDGGKLPEGYTYEYKTLDKTPDKQGLAAGTYNIIGNATAEAPGTIAEYTEFILEIQRNNTGYFVTYYDADGETILTQEKYYDTEALDKLDEEFVYAGFFASRNARATFSDVVLTTIAPEDDAPAEERPVEKIVPTLNIRSADIANSDTYLLSLIANVDGTVTIKLGGKVVAADLVAKADVKLDQEIALTGDKNELVIEFTPDPDQDLGEYTVLASTDKVTVNKTVTVNNKFEKYNNIYVGPNGKSTAKGTRKDPIDIYTAVACVKPGQTIVILEGTYLLDKTVRIERGMNGTEDSKIRMVADPEAKTRPVFDFQEKCPGIVHGGDYWYFNGFDVTNSEDRQKGFQVSGDNNVLDNIVAYHNGNTGIQLSRLYGTDLFEDWPANNLVLNCTSYGNEDTGYEDADGFAAKLTVGEGNVFDGCVAYNNADDGWDLYAKPETGPIGSVTIQNCVAYANGYMEDGRNAGNGNGFKMGGDGITGKHVLKNSYAFFNKAKGIDSNSCPDILVYNSISYNNESYNVAFYTKNNANTDFFADGIISFKDDTIKSGLTTGDNLEPLGTQDSTKYLGATNYYWDGSKSANAGGAEATAEWFKSLTFTGVTRNEDNTINMNGFLELTALAPAGVGAVPAGTASTVVVLEIDQYGDLSNAYMAWLVLIGAAFVTAGFFAKKKFA